MTPVRRTLAAVGPSGLDLLHQQTHRNIINPSNISTASILIDKLVPSYSNFRIFIFHPRLEWSSLTKLPKKLYKPPENSIFSSLYNKENAFALSFVVKY